MFTAKQEHRAAAEKLGLKTISIYTGLILEIAFWKGLGRFLPASLLSKHPFRPSLLGVNP